ncbi:hypothetical protein [Kaarinaea lacus]
MRKSGDIYPAKAAAGQNIPLEMSASTFHTKQIAVPAVYAISACLFIGQFTEFFENIRFTNPPGTLLPTESGRIYLDM